MVEVLSLVPPDALAVILTMATMAVVVGGITIVAQIVQAIQRCRERAIAASVISDMLDRGFGPQDIIAVLKAVGFETPPKADLRQRLQRWLNKEAKPECAAKI